MANILIHPNSGTVEFSTGVAGAQIFNPNFTGGALAARLQYDNFGGLNITSYVSNPSGLDRFSVDGANGRLFSVTDSLSGTLFSVNNIAGLPIVEVLDNNTVIMGAFNRNDFILTGNSLGLGGLPNTGTTKLYVSGNTILIGNLNVTGDILLSGRSVLTGIDLSSFYPRSNPSGFITGVDTSSLYPRSNPSGFITGVDLSNYVTKTNAEFTNRPTVNGTGVLLSGEGGTVTLPDTIVYTTGNQTISGTKTFDTRPQVNGTGVLLSGEGGVSTSSSKIIDKFTASSNQPPPSGFATLDTRSSVLVLDYDDTVTESGTFIGMIPETAVITGLQVRILWTATTATGNNCRWGARFADLSSSGINAPFDLGTEVNSAANSVSGRTSTADIFCSGTAGLAANEFYRLLIYRNSADTVNDTMAGDAELVSVTTYLT